MSRQGDLLEAVVTRLFIGIGRFIKTVYYGIKRMKDIKLLVAFVIFALLASIGWHKRHVIFSALDAPVYIQWLILCVLLSSPVLFLYATGNKPMRNISEYFDVFKEIQFAGKDKKYPVLISKHEDGKKEILAFKSNIPLSTWKKSVPQLETALDCSILKIEPMGSKKKTQLTTIDSSYQIPSNILWSDEYLSGEDGVVVCGENAMGLIKINLNSEAHILIAGTTGSGKSVTTRCITWQLIKKAAIPFLFDFKGGVEFGKKYQKYGEVVTDRERALEILRLIVEENALRLQKMFELEVKNIRELNECIGERLSRIVVVIDETSEMLDKTTAGSDEKDTIVEIIGCLSTIARQGRAPGINLILATQRPDANILPGQIKNNVPVRICGSFEDKSASEIVLGNTMAVNLPAIKGRFLFKSGSDTQEMQGHFFDDKTMLGEANNKDYHFLLLELQKYMVTGRSSSPGSSQVPKVQAGESNSSNKTNFDFKYKKAVSE